MLKRLTQQLARTTLLLMAAAALLVLSSCEDSTKERGIDWQPPANRSLPMGFEAAENVPPYARAWRMPPGFRGFPARWNARVRTYLEEELRKTRAIIEEEETRAAATDSTEAPNARLLYARAEEDKIRSRIAMGDYLVFLEERDLPTHLVWQDGHHQPELGDPAAIKGGSLRLALQRTFPNTLRVFGPNSNNSTRRYIYDDIELPLVRIHPQTRALIPGTADRWAVSPGGKTIYFHIDEKARYSNGDPLTTRDFVSSLFLRTSPYSAEPFYTDYYLSNFARIAVYGNNVMAVTLPTPRPYSAYYAGTLPSACTRFYAEFGPDYPTRYQWRAVPTTGGYAVDAEGVTMGSRIMLTRVKNWWAEKRRFTRYSCNVDHLVYSFIAEGAKIRELFRIGELDVISARDSDYWYEGLEIPPVHAGYIQRVRFANEWPRNSFGFHLNCVSPLFSDINARLGFHHALNVQAVINTLFRGDFRRGSSYFSGFGPFTDTSLRALPYNPEQARRYFAQAGYSVEGPDGILQREDGTRLRVLVSSRIDPIYAAAMNILREDAARCGLELDFEQLDDTIFYLKVKNKQYTACIFSWGFPPPVPDASPYFLSQYAVDADGKPIPGTSNITAIADPKLDQTILAARAATSMQDAIVAQHAVQQAIAATACWVPGWSSGFWRFAQWRWLRWPESETTHFCPPLYYDPLDSHLYWIDPQIVEETQRARSRGERYPEVERDIPCPPATPTGASRMTPTKKKTDDITTP